MTFQFERDICPLKQHQVGLDITSCPIECGQPKEDLHRKDDFFDDDVIFLMQSS